MALGVGIKRKVPLLDRLNVPAPVLGGLLYALLLLALRDRVLNVELDLSLRDVLMVAFFTTIGMGASLRVIRQGGRQVVLFFGLAIAGILLQDLLGMGGAWALRQDPRLGLMTGSVTLAGGPATALAFGPVFEKLGMTGATSLGLAAAIFGIVSGGVLGGYVGGSIVRKHQEGGKSGAAGDASAVIAATYADDPPALLASRLLETYENEHSSLFTNVLLLAGTMGVGTLISAGIARLHLTLPVYIGAMVVAAIVRNVDDAMGWRAISQQQMDQVGNIALNLFIVMALLSLQLWDLVHLAGPAVLILMAQVGLMVFLCHRLVYRVMGQDYEAAVMSGGYLGFMMGTTANAVACMSELTRKYGPAPRAFMVVGLVGASMIDFVNAVVVQYLLSVFT